LQLLSYPAGRVDSESKEGRKEEAIANAQAAVSVRMQLEIGIRDSGLMFG
jgi:hypothetical protein